MIKLSAFIDEYSPYLKEQIEGLKKLNINLIELRTVDNKNVSELSIEEAKKIKKELDKNGLTVWSIGSPIGKVDINENIENTLDKLDHTCEIAKIFATDKIRMFSFYNALSSREKVLSYLNKMVDLAKKHGITLYHENEKEIYGDTIERVVDIYENVDDIKLVYDPANFIQCGVDSNSSISKLIDKIAYFHIKDVIKESQFIVPAGYGDGNIKKIIKLIDDKDYTLSLEPHLADFNAFKAIDHSSLKHKFNFKDGKEAFIFAANALKGILISEGYKEIEIGIWEK